ncbi:MAG: hypothetical protein ABI348_03715, partial [Nitrososphaera sp.]
MTPATTLLYLAIAIAAIMTAAGFASIPAVHAQAAGTATGNKTLDVAIQPEWTNDGSGDVKFHLNFYEPGTKNLNQHNYYDFQIVQNGNVVFSAAKLTNQQNLHNVGGTATVPYKFGQNGDYTARVTLFGTGIPQVPINPENTDLPIKVTPEFPIGALGAVAAAMMA